MKINDNGAVRDMTDAEKEQWQLLPREEGLSQEQRIADLEEALALLLSEVTE